jgi:hypothetical protein
MEAQFLRNLKSADQAGRKPRGCFALGGFESWLDDHLSTAVEVIDQQEGHEGQENQKDCHTSPLRKGRRFLPLFVSGPLAVFAKGNRRTRAANPRRITVRSFFKDWIERLAGSAMPIASRLLLRDSTAQR